MPNQSRGLTAIPNHVATKLKKSTIEALEQDGHGLSFPKGDSCQLRVVRNGETLGGYYSFIAWGSVQKAVDAAMSRCKQLRLIPTASTHPEKPTGGVNFVSGIRRGNREYMYVVHYRNILGKSASRTFWMGRNVTADQQLHTFLTAKAFYTLSQIQGTEVDLKMFVPWKTKRLYTVDQEDFDWDASQG